MTEPTQSDDDRPDDTFVTYLYADADGHVVCDVVGTGDGDPDPFAMLTASLEALHEWENNGEPLVQLPTRFASVEDDFDET